jgi:hypothetical protein
MLVAQLQLTLGTHGYCCKGMECVCNSVPSAARCPATCCCCICRLLPRLLQDKEGGGEGDENKFDEFMGSDAGMFAGGQYDEDDREADRVWEEIDNFMDERRRVSEHTCYDSCR